MAEENLSDQVDVFSPSGELGTIPVAQVKDAVRNGGFKIASPQELDEVAKKEKYETTGQQIKTGLEGAASAATFGLSTGVERALGVKPEDIQARREVNPGVHTLGQVAGLAGSALIPGAGAAGLMGRAGEAAAVAAGIGEASTLAKIGSVAVKEAVQGAMMQSGDEVSKMLSGDPGQSVETAVTNVGLSGLLGGAGGAAIGSVSPLWKATAGPKVDAILDMFTKRTGGIEAQLPDEVMEAVRKTGLDVSPEIKSALSNDQWLRTKYGELLESNSKSGVQALENKNKFVDDIKNYVTTNFGKTPNQMDELVNLSEDKVGEAVNKKLGDYVKKEFEPSIKLFEKYKNKYSNTPLTSELDTIVDKIAIKNNDLFGLSPSSSEYKYGQTLISELPNLKTITDIGKRQTQIWDEAAKGNITWQAAGQFVGVLREAEEMAIIGAASKKGAKDVMDLQLARSSYGSAKEALDELNSYMKLKGYKGPESFIKVLGEAQNEKVLAKLAKENNAELLRYLQARLPDVADMVKQYHVDDMLRAASKGKDGFNLTKLSKIVDDMSPEFREFVVGPDMATKIGAADTLLKALPERMNPSGTAKVLEGKLARMTGSTMGALSMLLDNGNPLGFILAPLAKTLGRDAPDAAKLAMLQFIGSGKKIESGSFKAMTDFIQHTIDGENMVKKSIGSIFDAAKTTAYTIPSDAKIDKLDKQVDEYSIQLNKFFDVGGDSGYYMPEQAQSMGETSARAISYLAQLKPAKQKLAPLDPDFEDPIKEERYRRALEIAEQPMVITGSIKDGTLTAQDVVDLKNLYPNMYDKIYRGLYNGIVDTTSKKEDIPYKTRVSMSLFMGQPLDSTMTPQAILSNQAQPEPMNEAVKPSATGMKNMDKISKMYAGPLQKAQARNAQ